MHIDLVAVFAQNRDKLQSDIEISSIIVRHFFQSFKGSQHARRALYALGDLKVFEQDPSTRFQHVQDPRDNLFYARKLSKCTIHYQSILGRTGKTHMYQDKAAMDNVEAFWLKRKRLEEIYFPIHHVWWKRSVF